ncbi:hypothetical protein [Cryptosporangium sp. NPDC048952]|uniref:hypothetical protein n=1 Tax=Cryptosporangium sp. NPDC048952 TaxID=3363961 RepID=UPI003713009A
MLDIVTGDRLGEVIPAPGLSIVDTLAADAVRYRHSGRRLLPAGLVLAASGAIAELILATFF